MAAPPSFSSLKPNFLMNPALWVLGFCCFAHNEPMHVNPAANSAKTQLLMF